MEFAVKCPHCDSRLKASQDLMGVSVDCGYCLKELRVPVFEMPELSTGKLEEDEDSTSDGRPAWFVPAMSVGTVLLALTGLSWWLSSSAEDESPLKMAAAPANPSPPGNGIQTVDEDAAKDVPEPGTAEKTAPEEPQQEVPPRSPAETLAYLKAATVFVKVTTTAGEQSGSGFLIEHTPRGGHIVTNAHVVTPDEGRVMSVQCVFNSGRPNEKFLKARVVGRDDARDLAILFVSGRRLPEPIDSTPTKDLYETLPVHVFGFPFGEIFTTTQRSPDITVTRSSISALRRDEHDQLAFLQIDGGINPGNSGGPVVTEDGKLLGIAVAKLLGTEIGLAIPRGELKLALEGNLASLEFQKAKDGDGDPIFRLRPQFIDPRGRIESARLLTCNAGRIRNSEPNGDGSWVRVLREMDEHPLDLNVPTTFYPPTGSFSKKGWAWQVEWTYKDGQARASKPTVYDPEVLSEPKPESPGSTDGAVNPALVGTVETSKTPLTRSSAGSFSVIQLPDLMRSFAINPANGNIASVSPFSSRVFLYRAEGLIDNDSYATSVTIGARPSGIAFKKFGDLEVFVVVCSADENMYFVNAADASLVKQIPLGLRRPVDVFASSNDQDPYLYYTTKGRQLAVVDVREFKDRGRLLNNSAHGALSADGEILYRADGVSPSGFESLELLSDFSEPVPDFERILYEHRDAGVYVPDAIGKYTACGKKVYSARLNSTEAELDFIAGCSFKSVPVLAGISGNEVALASYDTLSSTGERIPLPDVLSRGTISLFGAIPQLEFPQAKLLADEHNLRLIYAAGNHLGIVPLSKFGIEP